MSLSSLREAMSGRAQSVQRALGVLLLGAVFAVGCGESLADRRDYTIEQIKQHHRGSDREDWLQVLRSATPESLAHPKILRATLLHRPNDAEIYVRVHWMESRPSPDGIRLLGRGGKLVHDLDISRGDREQNQSDSRRGILFAAAQIIDRNADLQTWQRLEDEVANGAMQLVLVKGGLEVSDPIEMLVVVR